MHSSPAWRDFEKLVARIEAALRPAGAVVTSPDRVPDVHTGTPREVDASVRCRVGSASILITIECRRRGQRQDCTWIEQLATKRQSIGADSTIAVSQKGFSREAVETARRHAIKLRQLTEITEEDVRSWLPSCRVRTEALVVYLLHHEVELYTAAPSIDISLPAHTKQMWTTDGRNAQAFAWPDGRTFSLNDLMDEGLRRSPDVVRRTMRTGQPSELPVRFGFRPGLVKTETNSGWLDVKSILVRLRVWFEESIADLSTAYDYQDADNSVLQGAEFNAPVAGLSRILSVNRDPATGRISFSQERIGTEWKDEDWQIGSNTVFMPGHVPLEVGDLGELS